jgi:hypothetical protein
MHKPLSPGRSGVRPAGRIKTIIACAVTLSAAFALSALLPIGKMLGQDRGSAAIGRILGKKPVSNASAMAAVPPSKEVAIQACFRVLNNQPSAELAARAGFASVAQAEDFVGRNQTALKAMASELRGPFENRFRQLADCLAPDDSVRPVINFEVEWRLVAAPPSLVGEAFKLRSVEGISPEDPALKRCFARSFEQPIAAKSETASLRGFTYDRVFPIPATYKM